MYYFEYDKKGFLFKYKESTNSEIELLIEKKNNSYNEDSVLSYYFLTGSTIYRVENYGIDKSDLELVGEIYGDNYYSVPKVKKQLFLENDKLYNFKIQIDNNNLMKWKSLIDFIN